MTHADIINCWPSLADFAADMAIAYGTAKAMRRRGSIPPTYWPLVVDAAAARGIDNVSLERLVSAKSNKNIQFDANADEKQGCAA